jgi:acetolactate synthase I/II/III large subunit
MKVSDYIAEFLHRKNISVVFEMAGGMITHLLDSIAQYKDIQIVSVHHEQAASFAADVYGRLTDKPGVALATSGPGATNLLTGIGSCYFDSSPALFITGQVNAHEQKGDRPIRQLGFQETDIVSMAKPITKAVYQITNPSDVPRIFEEAYTTALSGRPGPVLIDIPMNVQRGTVTELDRIGDRLANDATTAEISFEVLAQVCEWLAEAKRPVIIAGGGIRAGRALEAFQEFLRQTNLPVITSLLGLDSVPFRSSNRIGFWGSYGNRWANLAIGEADTMLVLGSRLDIRQTGADTGFFANKRIIHIDCESGEINNRINGCFGITADLNTFLTALNEYLKITKTEIQPTFSWTEEIEILREQWPDSKELEEIDGINPNQFMHCLSSKAGQVAAWVADVGNHQMWAAQSLEIGDTQRFLTSGGMGAMGFALPAAMGAAITLKKPVVMIAGDGGFQLNIQELQTIFRNKLPVKMVVINNNSLGMIRQFQDSYFDSRYQSTSWGYSAPDFSKIATAYCIESMSIDDEVDMESAVQWLLNDSAPKLLQVAVSFKANAYPKIAFGKPITEMEPFFKPIAMEAT